MPLHDDVVPDAAGGALLKVAYRSGPTHGSGNGNRTREKAIAERRDSFGRR